MMEPRTMHQNKFLLKVNMEAFFQNHKKRIVTLVHADEDTTIKSVQKRIKKHFNINHRLKFMTDDGEFIPEKEPAEILRYLPMIRAFNPDDVKEGTNVHLDSNQKTTEHVMQDKNKNRKRKFQSLEEAGSSMPSDHNKKKKKSDKKDCQGDKGKSNKENLDSIFQEKCNGNTKHVFFEADSSSSSDESSTDKPMHPARNLKFQCNLNGLDNCMPRLFEPYETSPPTNTKECLKENTLDSILRLKSNSHSYTSDGNDVHEDLDETLTACDESKQKSDDETTSDNNSGCPPRSIIKIENDTMVA